MRLPFHLSVTVLVACAASVDAVETSEPIAAPVDVVETTEPRPASLPVEVSPASVAGDPVATPDVALTARRVVIAASGDLVVSHRFRRAWRAMGEQAFDRMLEGWARVLRDEEIVLLNLETPLVDDVVPLRTGWPPILGAPAGLAEALSRSGVDVVSLSNNHAYDQGHLGVARTMELLDAVAIGHSGVGPSVGDAYRPVVVERDGVRVAFLSATAPMNLRPGAAGARPMYVARLWDERRVLSAVIAAREIADVVVLSAHWSRDFAVAPDQGQRRLVRRLIDAGVDVILGAGPHVLHPVERFESPRGEAVVAYSLGNLLSSMAPRYQPGDPPPRGYVHPANVMPAARDGVVLRIGLCLEDQGALRVCHLEATALWTINTERGHRASGAPLALRVVPLNAASAEVRAARGPVVAEALGEDVELSR